MTTQRIKYGTVTSPLGFLATGLHCGIKKNKPDLALIVSTGSAVAGATFTRNTAKAWPLLWSEQAIRNHTHRAILCNSGNANCFNGEGGRRAVIESVKVLSRELAVAPKSLLVSSTGIIGKPFPTKKLTGAIPGLVQSLSREGGSKAAQAILTTDRVPKEIALAFKIEGVEVRIGAIAKGAGMMNPHMATMLCFITTDADIAKPLLKKALRESVEETFNQVSVDNDMSTNDTVFILANGLAKNPRITRRGKPYRIFLSHLKRVSRYIAKELVKDGEGATRVAQIRIKGARTDEDAKRIARRIGQSMLFKTMLAGGDPNWGRVVASLGATGIPFDSKKLDVSFEGAKILQHGRVLVHHRAGVRKSLQRKEVSVEVNLNLGKGEARYLTCDLTPAYVRINSWLST
jgi:glutamate N-acetyltransferase/amino-acid N-acetyltransferase